MNEKADIDETKEAVEFLMQYERKQEERFREADQRVRNMRKVQDTQRKMSQP